MPESASKLWRFYKNVLVGVYVDPLANNPKYVAKKSYYQSRVFVCASVISSVDAVGRLLILFWEPGKER